jgi:predicted AlkP superfamily phosphohydrolase/phosphomutase
VSKRTFRKVVVVGLDGLDPGLAEKMMVQGELPSLRRLASLGSYARLRTTYPAQTPVAWSTFATGTNPGGHGIFDFLRRDPATYLPDIALVEYQRRGAFLPPRPVNRRQGKPLWNHLSERGIPSAILRCPCTFPPGKLKGRLLSGLGVPDLHGGFGTPTFYSTADVPAGESENVVKLQRRDDGRFEAHIVGPVNERTREPTPLRFSVFLDKPGRCVRLETPGRPQELRVREGEWSDWLQVKFKMGPFRCWRGILRFVLVSLEPEVELYASPINFDPTNPVFPISSPWELSRALAKSKGLFYTAGMVEDHTGLKNGRISEDVFLAQCDAVMLERERMMTSELDRFDSGFFFCLFDTPDRIQHMFWRFLDATHPANRGKDVSEYRQVIREHYRQCDGVVGRLLDAIDDETLLLVLSDHGFGGFQRGIHLNAWLRAQGYLILQHGIEPGQGAGDFLRHVDWDRTRAYALGLGSIYLNLQGREANGIVSPRDSTPLSQEIAQQLSGLADAERGSEAVRRVIPSEQLYSGPHTEDAPDLLVCCAPGYRSSWSTALGGIPDHLFEDNCKKWSGDHIIDPELVPGVLFANRPLTNGDPDLVDLAPSIMEALGVPRPTEFEGESLLVS